MISVFTARTRSRPPSAFAALWITDWGVCAAARARIAAPRIQMFDRIAIWAPSMHSSVNFQAYAETLFLGVPEDGAVLHVQPLLVQTCETVVANIVVKTTIGGREHSRLDLALDLGT